MTEKKVKIDLSTAVLKGSIKALDRLLGNMSSIATKFVGVGGIDTVALIALAGTLTVGLIRDMQQRQKDYESFIRKERGLKTHEEYLQWQATDRIATRMSYRGDTNQ